MNACVRWAPMIGARAGELSDEEARGLSEHLATCEACQARLADDAALSGMLGDALLREASARDFSRFSDEVLERIPAYRERRGFVGTLSGWVRHHRVAAVASVLAPAMAAVALVLYLGGGQPASEPSVDVSSESGGTMVLETSDGPMVLFADVGEGM